MTDQLSVEGIDVDSTGEYHAQVYEKLSTVENGERHTEESTAFIETVQTDRKPIVAVEDGIHTLEVVERIQSVATDE